MLKRQAKSDAKPHLKAPPRILVVDDNPDAARLIAKLFRRDGFEVAEVGDHQVALITLMNEPTPISAVIVSFSATGNASCLKLLDAVRHAPEPTVNNQRLVLLLDGERQLMLSWQSGADAVLVRPSSAEALVAAARQSIDRPDEARSSHRRQMVDRLREHAGGHPTARSASAPVAQFN